MQRYGKDWPDWRYDQRIYWAGFFVLQRPMQLAIMAKKPPRSELRPEKTRYSTRFVQAPQMQVILTRFYGHGIGTRVLATCSCWNDRCRQCRHAEVRNHPGICG